MRVIPLALCTAALALAVPANAKPAYCYQFEGASVLANGKFIGTITNKYDSKSIFNKYGSFGSKYASDSIWNPYGSFGGPYSSHSAFNKYTSTPPAVIKGGKIVAYLSVNKTVGGAVNPLVLGITCFDFEPD